MTWLKDAINDMFQLLMSLSLKARAMLCASIIFLVGGYYIMDRYLDYKTESLRIVAQPKQSDNKNINNINMGKAGRIDKITEKITALSGTQK